jgi:uncharacterized protein (TIGR03083 family)
MDPLDVIRRESDTFYDVAAGADPARPVPACPDWNLADLTWHLAEVHWFWAAIVEHRLQDPTEAEDRKPARPDGHDAVVELGRAGADHLLRVLAGADDATAVWTWADRQDVGFIRRHQVQEACVHRWDMQRSAGDDTPDAIEADAAVDSIDEFVEISLPWCVNPDKPLPGSVHLHCHDADGEWFVHPDGRVESIHAKGDVAVRGTASDLLLALYGRIDAGDLELIGDEALGRRFFASIDVG